jgi:LysR family hydrogen peroxide-inducible transcriptional activator
MVASGVGLTVLPSSAVPDKPKKNDLIAYRPFAAPVPDRRVALTWRKSFTRTAAIEALKSAIQASDLHGVKMLEMKAEALH